MGDISYIWADERWLYLAAVINLYSRAAIDWSIQPTMSRGLACDALKMALWRRGFPRRVLFHSDRGSQYCSHDYQERLKCYGIICSMSRKSNCWDNAVAESFFHTLKTELIDTQRYTTKKIAKQSMFNYMKVYYSRVRRHSIVEDLTTSLVKVLRLASRLSLKPKPSILPNKRPYPCLTSVSLEDSFWVSQVKLGQS